MVKLNQIPKQTLIADVLKTQLGDINFPIMMVLKRIIRVTEDEIIDVMQLIWERMKIVCEPSCAVTLSALIKEIDQFKNKNIGLIISRGNVDLANLPFK